MRHVLMQFSYMCHEYVDVSCLINISSTYASMGWLWLEGSMKLQVALAIEPYKRDDILPKIPMILSILLTVATP